jgi:hypothetical protein
MPLDAFPWKERARGVRRSYCWDCCRSYGREHYQRNRANYLERTRRRHVVDRDACRRLAYEYLETHPCVDCGETNLAVLDFDHRDRSTKQWSIASLIRQGNVALLAAEMAKCDVRCANDHRRRTARELGYSRWLARDG